MPRVWGIVIVLCLGFPVTGTASQQQAPESPNSTGQASASGAPQTKPQTEPKTEPKKKTDAGAAGAHAGSRSGKQGPAPAPEGAPRKIVVRKGGADEPKAQIVTGMTPEEGSRERQNTEELLNSTREILQQLSGPPLDAQRQETVSQIQNYIQGSRSALKEGDVARAHTLALKANLLADDLAKH